MTLQVCSFPLLLLGRSWGAFRWRRASQFGGNKEPGATIYRTAWFYQRYQLSGRVIWYVSPNRTISSTWDYPQSQSWHYIHYRRWVRPPLSSKLGLPSPSISTLPFSIYYLMGKSNNPQTWNSARHSPFRQLWHILLWAAEERLSSIRGEMANHKRWRYVDLLPWFVPGCRT